MISSILFVRKIDGGQSLCGCLLSRASNPALPGPCGPPSPLLDKDVFCQKSTSPWKSGVLQRLWTKVLVYSFHVKVLMANRFMCITNFRNGACTRMVLILHGVIQL